MAKVPVRASVYCRISRDKEGKALGVGRQRIDCLRRAEAEGWTIVRDGIKDTFTDNDISGAKDFTQRAAFGRLVKAAEAGQVDVVVAYSQARVYRNTIQFLELCEILKVAGVKTVALVADADVDLSGSLFIATVIAAKDEEERRRVGELVKRRLWEKAEAGEPTGGPRPFGYKVIDKTKLVVDEAEAALIREAAKKVLEGHSLRSIANQWNELGVRSTRGNPFGYMSVRRILTSARVAGLRQHKGEVLGKAQWPAILDEVTWKRVATILNDPSRRGPRASQSYPLRGLVVCSICGSYLSAVPRPSGRFYACKKDAGGCGSVSVKAAPLEQYLFGLILPILDHPYLREAVRSEDEQAATEAQKLVLANSQDEAKLSEIGEMFADDEMDHQTFVKQSQRLRSRIEARETQLASLRGRTALSRLRDNITMSDWDGMSGEDRRSIIQSVVGRIEIGKANKPGSHKFDPDRVSFGWGSSKVARSRGKFVMAQAKNA